MVASSIPGMAGADEKKLSVIFVPAETYQAQPDMVSFGLFVIARDRLEFWQLIALLSAVGLLLFLIGLFALNPGWRQTIVARLKSGKEPLSDPR
jgi:type III secretion protein J